MDNDTYGRSEADKLSLLAQVYEHNMNRLAEHIREDFSAETAQYRQEMSHFVESHIKHALDGVLKGYVGEMDAARRRMAAQAEEFNGCLQEVNRKNRQLAQRSWIITTACLAALAVMLLCGAWYAASLGNEIQKKKAESGLLDLLEKSDIVRCGEALCVRAEKADSNGYRVVKPR